MDQVKKNTQAADKLQQLYKMCQELMQKIENLERQQVRKSVRETVINPEMLKKMSFAEIDEYVDNLEAGQQE